MMMRARVVVPLVCTLLLGSLAPLTRAHACSVTRLPPTNYELVSSAERIVVVRAPKAPEAAAPRKEAETGPIAMRVLRVLKGAPAAGPDEAITVSGNFDYRGRGDRDKVDTPRPGVMRGMCVAWDYKSEGTFVLFVKRIGGAWVLEARPLTRSNEEIDESGDVWEELITTYVRLGKLPKKKAATERARLIARAKRADAAPHERTIGLDLEVDTLSKPARRKSP